MNKRKVIGAILGIIFYGACVFFFTYAYYNWKSDNTPVGLNITDKSLEVEFETGPEVNSLNIGPVLDYNDGESTTFKVYNPTENPIYINTALDITTISDNLKTEYFKYKLLVDRSGGTNFTELVTEGNFLNLNVGSNNLLLSFLVPVDSIYNYKFIVYIDGNIYNNNNIQENILESNLVVTEGSKVLLTFDPNGGNDGITEKEVYMGQTYGDLPTPTRSGYTFNGWYTAESGGTQVVASNLITSMEDQILYAQWTPNAYKVTYNSGNLLYGLVDIGNTKVDGITLSISNKIVTVTATRDDGYGFSSGRVYLEAGKEYIFSCDTNKEWGLSSGTDTVEAFLMLDGQYNTYYHMDEKKNIFTPGTSGIYYLRLDVNKNGETATFSNITISYNVSQKEVLYDNPYGDMPTVSRTGYAFVGWFDDNYKNNPLNYYADRYSDLYNAYGYNETKLYNHYVNYGKAEGRIVSQYLSTDIVKKTNEHTLYAGLKANNYTIKYMANGGSGTMTEQTATYNQSFTVSSNSFTRQNYIFAGWTTNSNGTDDGYGWTNWSGTWKYENGQRGISNNTLTLYARWTSNIISHSSTGGHSADAVGPTAATWSFHKFDKVYTSVPTFSWTGGDDYTSHQIVAISQMGVVLKAVNGSGSQQWPWYTWKVTGNAYNSVPAGVAQNGTISVGGVGSGSRSYTVTYTTPYTKAPKLYVVNHATHYSCSVSITSQSAKGFTVKHTNSSSSTQYDSIYWMAVDSNY